MLKLGCGGWCCKIFLFVCSGAIMLVGLIVSVLAGLSLTGKAEQVDFKKDMKLTDKQLNALKQLDCKMSPAFSSAMDQTAMGAVSMVVGILMLLIGVGGVLGALCNNNCMLNIQSCSLFVLVTLKIAFIVLIEVVLSKYFEEIAVIKMKMIPKVLNGGLDTQPKLEEFRDELSEVHTRKLVDKLFGPMDTDESRKTLKSDACCQIQMMHTMATIALEDLRTVGLFKLERNNSEYYEHELICCGAQHGDVKLDKAFKCTTVLKHDNTEANNYMCASNGDNVNDATEIAFKAATVAKCTEKQAKLYSPSSNQLLPLMIAFIFCGVFELIAGIANCCFMHCVSSAKEERLNEKPPSAPKTTNAPVSQNPPSQPPA